MIKQKIFISTAIAFLFVFILLMGLKLLPEFAKADLGQTQSDFYWSEENEPVFYGAIGATISKDVEFDVKDPRFRLFAHDFEDGDVAVVCESNNVKSGNPGNYQVVYSATDKHNNRSEITVEITITEDTNGEIDCIRRIHTIPNDWNMMQAGFNRNHNGDREILGIFMPENSTFQFKILSQDWAEAKLTLFNNHRNYEKHLKDKDYNTVVKYSTEFTTIKLENKNDEPHDCVPFIVSQLLERGQDIQTTYDYEIKYNQNEVKKLDYYYYGEDEEAYLNGLQNGTNTFGVVESPDLLILMPKQDVSKIFNYNFKSLKSHLDYYGQVIAMMDEMIGLSFQPKKATDQNFRAKQFIKGDGGTGGGAYYNSAFGFIGIGGGQVYSFYEMNWGGLHEIAHGYQGVLGGGSLGLGEVSNNILGHYVQMSDVYNITDRIGLGDLAKVEDNRNQKRINEGKGFLDTTEGFEGVRLYALVNLLDAFEGKETYAKLFSWYREMLDKKVFTANTLNQQDAISTFFAQEYDADIIPYWQQWGIEVSKEVRDKIITTTHNHFSILKDVATSKTEEIMEGEQTDRKYGLVAEQTLAKYGVKSDVNITYDIAEPQLLENKMLLLEKEGKIVYQIKITNGKANFSKIPTGSYVIRSPFLERYSTEYKYYTFKNGVNDLTIKYQPIKRYDENTYYPMQLKILGVRGTDGLRLTFSNNNHTAVLYRGAADLGNHNFSTDQIFMSVKFQKPNGESIWEHNIYGGSTADNAHYFSAVKVPDITYDDLEYGSTISITTERPDLVKVISLNTNSVMTSYQTESKEITFKITERGLEPQYLQDFDFTDAFYESVKDSMVQRLKSLSKYFQDNPDQLDAKCFSSAEKNSFIEGYLNLKEQDRTPYIDTYNAILVGGKPMITLSKTEFEYSKNIDFAQYITAFDYEDGYIELNNTNFMVKAASDLSMPGIHQIEIQVTDLEGNTSSQTFEITIKAKPEPTFNSTWIIIGCAVGGILLCCTGFAIFVAKKKEKTK